MESRDKLNLGIVIANFEREYSSSDFLAHGETSECLDSYGAVLGYLAKKGSGRQFFRHYATRARIASILDGSALYLTDGSGWNDEYDRNRFNPPFSGYKKFGLCLSATSSESIAMWMLYGGMDGNGAMINFDKSTLVAAMSQAKYECGFFENDEFRTVVELDASKISFELVDVLYFSYDKNGESVIVERVGETQVRMNTNAFAGIAQIAKHKAWSYEKEVRLVASVSKLALGTKASKVTAIKVPLTLSEDYASSKVFDSPVSDGDGEYRDSELLGTVEWDLCKNCTRK